VALRAERPFLGLEKVDWEVRLVGSRIRIKDAEVAMALG